MDLQQYINQQLQGSSVIDNAIAQVFSTNPIDMKLKEIGYLLDKDYGLDFKYMFEPRSLAYHFQVSYDGVNYEGAIPDLVLKCESVDNIIKTIMDMILTESTQIDPEWISDNENEQAMLDAAMDYGFV